MKTQRIRAIFLLLFFFVVSLSALVVPTQTDAQSGRCDFGNESWTDDVRFKPGVINGFYDPNDPPTTELIIDTLGECAGNRMNIIIWNRTGDDYIVMNWTTPPGQGVPVNYAQRKITFEIVPDNCSAEAGETETCSYQAEVKMFDGSGNQVGGTAKSDELDIKIDGDRTNPSGEWNILSDEWEVQSDLSPCISSVIGISLLDGSNVVELTPGQDISSYYSDEDPPNIKIRFMLQGCGGKVREHFSAYNHFFIPDPNPDGYGYIHDFVGGSIAKQNIEGIHELAIVELTYALADGVCKENALGSTYNCQLAFLTSEQASFERTFPSIKNNAWDQALQDRNVAAHVKFYCDGTCDTEGPGITDREYLECLDEDCNQTRQIELYDNPFLANYLASIKNSPCYIPPTDPSDPSDLGTLKEDCYELLAPLPGLEAIGVPEEQIDENNSGQFTLGIWVNRIVTFMIGLLGLGAVVMIIIAGVQYMTSSLVSAKQGAKERISDALIGLLIALGIYVILATINPNLLDINPDVETVTIEFDYPEDSGIAILGVDPNDIPDDGYSSGDICINAEFIQWAQNNAPKLDFTDQNGQSYQITPCNTAEMDNVNLFGAGNTLVHQSLSNSIGRINNAYSQAVGNGNSYTVTEVGGYCCRLIRDQNGNLGNPPKISKHAYGVAVDLNQSTNPFQSTLQTDMPNWFVQIWTNEGWGWGGNWSGTKDPMHFSKYGPEQGNQLGER